MALKVLQAVLSAAIVPDLVSGLAGTLAAFFLWKHNYASVGNNFQYVIEQFLQDLILAEKNMNVSSRKAIISEMYQVGS